MKVKFVQTANVRVFTSVAESLKGREAGIPGLGLIYGQRGLGKSRTARWYESQSEDTVYLLAVPEWDYGWFLEALCVELGLAVPRGIRSKHAAVVDTLLERPRLLIIDEVNGLAGKVLESIRILSELTDTPVLFIGHEGVVNKLMRLGPLFDRLLYMAEFKPLDKSDLRLLASCCVLPVTEEAIDVVLHSRAGGRIRPSLVAFKRMETRAQNGRDASIGAVHFDARDIEAAKVKAERNRKAA